MSKSDTSSYATLDACLSTGSLYRNENGNHSKLLIFIPGWVHEPKRFFPLLNSLVTDGSANNILFDADIFPYKYNNGLLSNEKPDNICQTLVTTIEEFYTTHNYSEIYILGHSIGALLARRVVLMAKEEKYEWYRHLKRIVMLAGTNRGFTPQHTSHKVGIFIISLLNRNIATLIMDMQLGSKWVTSLRMKWIKTFNYGKMQSPKIVQLFGDRDLMIAEDDAIDLYRFDVSVIDKIEGATHSDFCAMEKGGKVSGYGNIVEAFTRNDFILGEAHKFIKKREKLIFLIHGIRDFAEWHHALEYEIEKQDKKIDVIPVQYGYFNLLQFLLPHQQKRAVRVFVDKYVQEVSLSPDADIEVAAHSNGTLVFQQAIQEHDYIDVRKVFFAGSVVSQNTGWDTGQYYGRIKHLRNVCANKDVPVGFLCKALHVFPFFNFGTAGYSGFKSGGGSNDGKGRNSVVENCYIQGGHGTALKTVHRKGLVEYLLDSENTSSSNTSYHDKPLKSPLWFRILSLAAVCVLVACIVLIVGAYWYVGLIPDKGVSVFLAAMLTVLLLWLLQKI